MPLSKIKTNSIADEVFETGPNLIINGAMQVAQRGTSAVAAGAGTYPSIDRFKAWETTGGAYTVEQSTIAPAGFTTSLKAQVTTADTSLGATQYAQLSQQIEAQNLQRLDYGTSDAKTITLSFHVRSNKTGSYSITIYKQDSTVYLFSKSFTIDSADTWEKKIITITPTAGGTSFMTSSGGAIANDSGIGFYVFWNLAQGSAYKGATDNAWSSSNSDYSDSSQVNWMDSTSNNFYLTGVQLEVGDSATPFQHESYEATLRKCQRYYFPAENYNIYSGWAMTWSSGTQYPKVNADFPVPMRASPTITYAQSNNNTANQIEWVDGSTTGASSWGVGVNGIYYVFTSSTIGANLSGQFRYTANAEL